MSKVLGISFGRKMSNCDVMVKEALLQCKAAGHEIQFIRADDLDIHNCTGCIACVMGLMMGKPGNCVHKDDFHIIDDAVMEADAVIYVCPTYETSPTGRFKTICDRFGPSHDLAFRTEAIREGRAAGKADSELPDVRAIKPRVGAFVSVGGAMTKNWLAMMEPVMFELAMPLGIDIVDNYEYHGAMAYNHVVGNEPVMQRMAKMGENIVEALAAQEAGNEAERTKWRGDHEGVCPVCHGHLVTVLEGCRADTIECPICGIEGSLAIEDGIIKANFTEAQKARSRLYYAGKLEHATEIKTKPAPPGQIPDLQERLEKYRW